MAKITFLFRILKKVANNLQNQINNHTFANESKISIYLKKNRKRCIGCCLGL